MVNLSDESLWGINGGYQWLLLISDPSGKTEMEFFAGNPNQIIDAGSYDTFKISVGFNGREEIDTTVVQDPIPRGDLEHKDDVIVGV